MMNLLNRVKDRKSALILALGIFSLDQIVTLIGQPPYAERIAGNVDEANWFFATAMQHGWVTHIALTLLWAAAISISILAFSRLIGLAFAYAWIVGHSVGALSWLADPEGYLGYWVIYPFCLAVGVGCALVAKSFFGLKSSASS